MDIPDAQIKLIYHSLEIAEVILVDYWEKKRPPLGTPVVGNEIDS